MADPHYKVLSKKGKDLIVGSKDLGIYSDDWVDTSIVNIVHNDLWYTFEYVLTDFDNDEFKSVALFKEME